MSFEIRSDLPIPKPWSRGCKRIEYPFESLQVGQCIVVPYAQRSALAKKARIFTDANPGWVFCNRSIDKGVTMGLWCMARPAVSAERGLPETVAPPMPKGAPPAGPLNSKLREAAKLTQTGTRTVVRR